MELTLPLTKEIAKTLKVGDIIYLTGFVYTCRDAAHKKIEIALKHGEKPPVDLKNQIIYYAGPCPARPGLPIGSNGPTTAARMDPFVEMMFQQGVTAFLGKGDRADYVADLCKNMVASPYWGLVELLPSIRNMSNQLKFLPMVNWAPNP